MIKEERLGTVHLGEVAKELSQPPREDALSVAPVPGEANHLGVLFPCQVEPEELPSSLLAPRSSLFSSSGDFSPPSCTSYPPKFGGEGVSRLFVVLVRLCSCRVIVLLPCASSSHSLLRVLSAVVLLLPFSALPLPPFSSSLLPFYLATLLPFYLATLLPSSPFIPIIPIIPIIPTHFCWRATPNP